MDPRESEIFLKREFNKVPGYYDRIANFQDREYRGRRPRRQRTRSVSNFSRARRKSKYFSFPFSAEAQQIFISNESINLRKNDDIGSKYHARGLRLFHLPLASFPSVVARSRARRSRRRLTFIAKLRYHLAFIKPSSVFGGYFPVSLCR